MVGLWLISETGIQSQGPDYCSPQGIPKSPCLVRDRRRSLLDTGLCCSVPAMPEGDSGFVLPRVMVPGSPTFPFSSLCRRG